MENKDLFKEVAQVIAEVAECNISDIKPDSDLLNDLGVTSLMGLEIFVDIEKKFKISLEEDYLVQMKTPNNIIEIIEEKLQEA